MSRLENKIALITGGAQGIGAVTAKRFAEEGAAVILWDVDSNAGQKTSKNIANSRFMKVNVAKLGEVQTAAYTVQEEFGRIDILINNAGITCDAMLHKMDEAQWDAVIDINLKGVFACAQAVGTIMRGQGNGVIINTSSVVALYGNFGQTNYVAAKSGIIGMTKVWARELGYKGVRVNAVAPGFIATDMVKSVPEKVITMLEEKTPLGRLGAPEDIANAYLFLASDEAAFINGAVLSVDGGLIL